MSTNFTEARTINVTLTVREADALLYAVGNSLCTWEDAIALFNEDVKAAQRAEEKILAKLGKEGR